MNYVRHTRKVLGLSQLALAIRAGVSPATLVAVERYGYRPTEPVRQRIAAALNERPNDLWPEEGTDDTCPAI